MPAQRCMISLLAAFAAGAAPASGAAKSLCKPDEVVFATARALRVGKVSSASPPAEKWVSVCADHDKEPIHKLVYRFGTPGAIEIEIVASSRSKAGIVLQSDKDAHLGVKSLVFFSKSHSYVVSEGLGMANVSRLTVYKHKARVAEFSLADLQSSLSAIDPGALKSPALRRVEPIEPL